MGKRPDTATRENTGQAGSSTLERVMWTPASPRKHAK